MARHTQTERINQNGWGEHGGDDRVKESLLRMLCTQGVCHFHVTCRSCGTESFGEESNLCEASSFLSFLTSIHWWPRSGNVQLMLRKTCLISHIHRPGQAMLGAQHMIATQIQSKTIFCWHLKATITDFFSKNYTIVCGWYIRSGAIEEGCSLSHCHVLFYSTWISIRLRIPEQRKIYDHIDDDIYTHYFVFFSTVHIYTSIRYR